MAGISWNFSRVRARSLKETVVRLNKLRRNYSSLFTYSIFGVHYVTTTDWHAIIKNKFISAIPWLFTVYMMSTVPSIWNCKKNRSSHFPETQFLPFGMSIHYSQEFQYVRMISYTINFTQLTHLINFPIVFVIILWWEASSKHTYKNHYHDPFGVERYILLSSSW